MLRSALIILAASTIVATANAQTMVLSTASGDYQATTVFSNVGFFSIEIEIDEPLAPGVYVDPNIVSVSYQVTGTLEPGTPSGFPAFDLQRDITGTEFYAQGSSLGFEIMPSAVLTDGIQAVELVGNGIVLTFNAREIGNGRFHPALLELDANGTGRIQNSNNVPSQNPLVEVNFGEEYITDLVFDPGNTTLITERPPPLARISRGGSGATSLLSVGALILLVFARRRILQRHAAGHR